MHARSGSSHTGHARGPDEGAPDRPRRHVLSWMRKPRLWQSTEQYGTLHRSHCGRLHAKQGRASVVASDATGSSGGSSARSIDAFKHALNDATATQRLLCAQDARAICERLLRARASCLILPGPLPIFPQSLPVSPSPQRPLFYTY